MAGKVQARGSLPGAATIHRSRCSHHLERGIHEQPLTAAPTDGALWTAWEIGALARIAPADSGLLDRMGVRTAGDGAPAEGGPLDCGA
ncbi:hypothetical protein GCM10010278_65890 [Streptomyces melanogenes]|nr:hypothetical protein GCM10010278_65890 [Streptomyces melanogenes]